MSGPQPCKIYCEISSRIITIADGHVAFNEPGSSLTSRTRLKTLAVDTIIANQEHFAKVKWDPNAEDPISKKLIEQKRDCRVAGNNGDDSSIRRIEKEGAFVVDNKLETPVVPQTALTVGVGTVMDAKEVMIIVTGHGKALALAKCIEEGVSHQWTVSMVQLHSHATVVCDDASTSEMRVRTVDYYKGLNNLHNKLLGEDNPDEIEVDQTTARQNKIKEVAAEQKAKLVRKAPPRAAPKPRNSGIQVSISLPSNFIQQCGILALAATLGFAAAKYLK